MQELENILEEIEQRKTSAEKLIVKPPHDKLDQVANDTAEAFIEAYKECQEIIRKHMNDGWISVDDRLPKTNGTYNVTRHIDGHFISDSAYFDGQNTWHSDNRVNHSRPYLTDVIAWRPLSEPYRPERSNDEKK